MSTLLLQFCSLKTASVLWWIIYMDMNDITLQRSKSLKEQMEGGMNRRATKKYKKKKRKEKGERNRKKWVVDSSFCTLGWCLQCLCVWVCVLQMSNSLWRACLSCLVVHPFHHYMPSISHLSISLSAPSVPLLSSVYLFFPLSPFFFNPDRLILRRLHSPWGA